MTSTIRCRRLTAVVLALLLTMPTIPLVQETAASPHPVQESAPAPRFSSPESAMAQTPLYFEANAGQTDPQVRYIVRGAGAPTFITDNELVAVLRERRPKPNLETFAKDLPAKRPEVPAFSGSAEIVRMRLEGAAEHPNAEGVDELESISAYFIGDDPSKWVGRVPHYGKVQLSGVYPGIDLVYHGTRGQLEYDFVVQPGADPSAIALQFEGVRSMRTDAAGDLLLGTRLGEIRQHRPQVYQTLRGRLTEVSASYKVRGSAVRFDVAGYDRTQPLIIDPVVAYSTLLGGSEYDEGRRITVDSAGNAYVTGYTRSLDFPTSGAVQPSNRGGEDVFVSKINAATGWLAWSTYLGGSDADYPTGIAIESDGTTVHVTGVTRSINFPTVLPFQTNQDGADAFVTKLVYLGSSLMLAHSTYLGGDSDEDASAIKVNTAGYVAVSGCTKSPDFPQLYNLQPYNGGGADSEISGCGDAFVTVFKPQRGGTSPGLYFSTYLGGYRAEDATEVYWDATGGAPELVVVGQTFSSNFPVVRALKSRLGGPDDAFVTRISFGPQPPNSPSPALVYSTFLGGSHGDGARSVSGDAGGSIYVVGFTLSTDFPTEHAYQNATSTNPFDTFLTKLVYSGGVLSMPFSTYLGGTDGDLAQDVSADPSGQFVTVSIITNSTDLPVIQTGWWADDRYTAYVVRWSIDSGNSPDIYWSGYLRDTGIGSQSKLPGIAHYQDQKGKHHIYVTGVAASSDAFVIKIDQ